MIVGILKEVNHDNKKGNGNMIVKFYDTVPDNLLKFSVVISKSKGKWVLCKHKERTTYEVPGGMRENGESILETAKRELYEETGAIDFNIKPISAYSYSISEDECSMQDETYGMLYYAEIERFEDELHYEIENIILSTNLNVNWTYKEIMPKLLEEAKKRNFMT